MSEIEALEAGEQDEVIRFATALATKGRLTGEELTGLAAQLPGREGSDTDNLKQELERGFYGTAFCV
jgi:hypothetical protein